MIYHDIYFSVFYFTQYDLWLIHVAENDIILFFLWLSNIPFCICTTSSLSIPLSMDI